MRARSTYDLFAELMERVGLNEIRDRLFVHRGTLVRWIKLKRAPDDYYNDINRMLGNKYPPKVSFRSQDQFYTTPDTARRCYKKTLEVLKQLGIDEKGYTFIEPAAGCCSFYSILPKERRIGIDIDPKGDLRTKLIKSDYLDWKPKKKDKYIVIGNPPFGLRGNLALRFIQHSLDFADVVAFILPPLFNSTGKGVPMTRIKGYCLAHSEKLPPDSYEYPDSTPVEVATIFQVWTRVGCDRIRKEVPATCKTYARIYSLSDGGTPSSTRNKKMIGRCDVYLPSTCFSGMKAYGSFEELPNQRGYGVKALRDAEGIKKAIFDADWENIAFVSTNGALNLRTDIIENQIVKGGFKDA